MTTLFTVVDRLNVRRFNKGTLQYSVELGTEWIDDDELIGADDLKEAYEELHNKTWIQLCGSKLEVAYYIRPRELAVKKAKREEIQDFVLCKIWQSDSAFWQQDDVFKCRRNSDGKISTLKKLPVASADSTLSSQFLLRLSRSIAEEVNFFYGEWNTDMRLPAKRIKDNANKLMDFVLENCIHIMKDGHLHRLLLCIMYATFKAMKKLNVDNNEDFEAVSSFSRIAEWYHGSTLAKSDVNQVIGDEPEPLCMFYNRVFLPVVKDKLLELRPQERLPAPIQRVPAETEERQVQELPPQRFNRHVEQPVRYGFWGCSMKWTQGDTETDKAFYYSFHFNLLGILCLFLAGIWALYTIWPQKKNNGVNGFERAFNTVVFSLACVTGYFGLQLWKLTSFGGDRRRRIRAITVRSLWSLAIFIALFVAVLLAIIHGFSSGDISDSNNSASTNCSNI